MIYVFGSGGFALCVVEALFSRNEKDVTIVSREHQAHKMPCPIIEEEQLQISNIKKAFVAVGDNFKRFQVVQKLLVQQPEIEFVNAIHSSAVLGINISLDHGIYIGAGTVIGPQVKVGHFGVLNSGVTIEHNCELGNYLNIGTGSSIAGTVKVGDRSILGVNTTILHNICIGEDVLLASGACVVQNVKDAIIMMGVPARNKGVRKFGDAFL